MMLALTFGQVLAGTPATTAGGDDSSALLTAQASPDDDEGEDDCNCTNFQTHTLAASADYCAKKQASADAQAAVDAHKQKDADLKAALDAAEIALLLAENAGADDMIIALAKQAVADLEEEIDQNLEDWLDANDTLSAALQAEATAKSLAQTLHQGWKLCCADQTADSCPGCPEGPDPLLCP